MAALIKANRLSDLTNVPINEELTMRNNTISVCINKFNKTTIDIFLRSKKIDRQYLAQRILDYLCSKFKIQNLKVYIFNECGINHYFDKVIYIYNNQKLEPIEILNVLLMYFMKHYDLYYLKLNHCVMDEYFKQRFENLRKKLIDL